MTAAPDVECALPPDVVCEPEDEAGVVFTEGEVDWETEEEAEGEPAVPAIREDGVPCGLACAFVCSARPEQWARDGGDEDMGGGLQWESMNLAWGKD